MDNRRELVTAALLGTDRRPVDGAGDEDPALVLLERAARSGTVERAGRVLARVDIPAPRPTGHPPWAPAAAQDVMDRLLVRPQPVLVNLWLAAAAVRGLGLAPQQWPAVAAYAARAAEVNRPALSAVLGEAGRWFVGQNPQWTRLVAALTDPPPPDLPSTACLVEPEHLGVDPELIFTVADPWPRPLIEVVLMILGTARLQWRTPAYAAAVAARLPEQHLPLVRSALAYFAPPDGPPADRLVRDAFGALDSTLQLRVEIDQAFGVAAPGRHLEESS